MTQGEKITQEVMDEVALVCQWADENGHRTTAEFLKHHWHALMLTKYRFRDREVRQ